MIRVIFGVGLGSVWGKIWGRVTGYLYKGTLTLLTCPTLTLNKRKAVLTMLNDKEWSKWSNVEIAKRCNVSDMTVHRVKTSHFNKVDVSAQSTYTTKHGTIATMNTAPDVKQVFKNKSLSADSLQGVGAGIFSTGHKCRTNSGPFLLGNLKKWLSQTRRVRCS